MKPVTIREPTMKIAALNSFLPIMARNNPITIKMGPKMYLKSWMNWMRALKVKMGHAVELV